MLLADLFEHLVVLGESLPAIAVETLLSLAVFIVKLEGLGSSQAPVLVELVVIFIKEIDVWKRLGFAEFSPLEFKGAMGIMFIREGEGQANLTANLVDRNEFFVLAIAAVVIGAFEVIPTRLSLDLVGSSKDQQSEREQFEEHADGLSSEKANFQKEKWQ